tara:strand:+ start:441 stop:2165 length:1725 start_codon:yes stop_codon:yes gene_type:complete
MNKKILLIQKFLNSKDYSFYLATNSDIHLNESPNLHQKEIFNLTGFDCSNGYLLILNKKIIFFTDSRYTLAAKNFFDKNCDIFDLKDQKISDYILSIGSNISGIIDPKLISISEINNLKIKLKKSDIKIIPLFKNLFQKNYYPDFKISYPFSLPKYCCPRKFNHNIKWIKDHLKSDGFLIWNNSHIAYLLNIRSFEIQNSTKPFAGLFISKKLDKPIIISKNKFLNKLDKINKYFDLMTQQRFIKIINSKNINKIEIQYKYTNYDIYLKLAKKTLINNSSIDLDRRISKKTTIEFNNIKICHQEDGLSLTKFILNFNKDNKKFVNEFSISNHLYQIRKEGINFFRNSFDYISGLDENAAIVHYKPTKEKSRKLTNQSILLLDSGAHYLEGTTDVTRVIKLNNLKYRSVKKFYTYLLKSLILIEKTIFKKGTTGSDLDSFIRNYLSNFDIIYGHGTGHGVGYFNDVHEKYPIIGPNSKDIILNNNLFSIEPGYYLSRKFGLRIENLYFSKIVNNNIKLKNMTLVPYDLSLIDWKLINQKEKKFIKSYHQNIFDIFEIHLNKFEKKIFKKNLIDKI